MEKLSEQYAKCENVDKETEIKLIHGTEKVISISSTYKWYLHARHRMMKNLLVPDLNSVPSSQYREY